MGVMLKVGSLLRTLATEEEATASQLADATGEPRSSIYRLLGDLQDVGFVEPGERRGGFRLGIELFRLGSAVQARFDERTAALPVLKRLSAETGQTTYICVRRERNAVCIESIGGRIRLEALDVGLLVPLVEAGAGRVLLAYSDDSLIEEILGEVAETAGAARKLRSELREISARGYSVDREDLVEGIGSVSAPIFGSDEGRAVASLTIAGASAVVADAELEDIREAVLAAAQEISARLGHVDASASEPPAH